MANLIKFSVFLGLLNSFGFSQDKVKTSSGVEEAITGVTSVGDCYMKSYESLENLNTVLNDRNAFSISVSMNIDLVVDGIDKHMIYTKEKSGFSKTKSETLDREVPFYGRIKEKSFSRSLSLSDIDGQRKSFGELSLEVAAAKLYVASECESFRKSELSQIGW